MTITALWLDPVSGAPSYNGATLRQSFSVLAGYAPAGRPLGATSGVRPGTPTTTVTATSSTWTIGTHSGILDVETSATAGPYFYAITAAETGSMNAADATNPRIDLISLQLSDPSQSDGSSTPSVAAVYTPGTPAATPVPPSAPARSLVLAQVNVPKSGGGSPSVTWVAPLTAAGAAYGTFTPVWTNVTVGNGSQVGEYQINGKVMTLRIWLAFGSTTAISGNVSVALPGSFTAANDGQPQDLFARIGYGASGGTRCTGFATVAAGGNSLAIYEPTSTTNGAMVQLGSFGQTFGAGSMISVQGTLILA